MQLPLRWEHVQIEMLKIIMDHKPSFYSLSSKTYHARSREASKPCDSDLDFFNSPEIWQVSLQQRYYYYDIQSHGFETSRDLAVRR